MQYSSKRVSGSATFDDGTTVPFLGYMDNTFIEADYNADAVMPHIGGQGDVTAVLNADKTAKVTVTFVQGAVTNGLLASKVPDARINYLPRCTISFRDLDGNDVVTGAGAWIVKMAKVSFGKEIQGREWTFFLPDATIVAGGDED